MIIQTRITGRTVSKTFYLLTFFILGSIVLSADIKTVKAQGTGTGILRICKNAEGPGLDNRVFQFRIGGIVREAPVGGCTGPIELPAGLVTVEELLEGRTLPAGTFTSRFRLLSVESSVAGSLQSVNLPLRAAVIKVREGDAANQTVVTFTNTFAVFSVIEICNNAALPALADNEDSAAKSPGETGFSDFTVDVIQNTVFRVPFGGCSGLIQVNVPVFTVPFIGRGDVIVTQLAQPGFTLESVSATSATVTPNNVFNEFVRGIGVSNTNPACINERRDLNTNAVMTGFALPASCFFVNPGGGYASVDIMEGGTASMTKINFITRANVGRRTAFDYDGDGRADVSVFRPSTNRWYELLSSNLRVAEQTFGLSGDIIAPADFDGDGKTDIAIFRPSSGDWWYLSSVDNVQKSVKWGQAGDVPLPGDFDGDGRADFIVYRPSNNSWYRLSRVGQTSITRFGTAEDKPVMGDFDGDGKSDLAIFRPSTGDWWYLASSDGSTRTLHFGIETDTPVPADYDGDGRTDFAVYRESERTWYIYNRSTNSHSTTQFGLAGDEPVPADYDGDGRADIAVYRRSEGNWYILRSSQGFTVLKLGISTDIPTPGAFIP
ncbi:MAG: repeat-containing protein [Acidobacteria bacterium]|nr:repeat-containing protein [Acidobacteriota bacterium]